ncbi:pyruvate formate-lyase-activating protein [uncultured Ilyobacter sp.]|uniref:pyruvate formate-lyase-activating protein n=1 Tax=uncultured Ilyobacter sp. TaxID=544433 RepID=UPI0029F4EA52|nr:pyruvate formate-lyase-activating protein [uncultured Ilyobacter sp.]
MAKLLGKLHSYESCGTVDGPGLRYVVFTQGCPLRCKYCHNPDTWHMSDASYEEDANYVVKEIVRYKPFFKNGGGMTLSGGEPFMQAEFAKELFRLCKENGINTAVDTSGIYLNDTVKEALEYVDLVLLDIKCIDPEIYEDLTKVELEPTLKFAKYLSDIKKPVWIRHVLVPGITDREDLLEKLGDFVASLENVERMEILPYHSMGEYKWEEMGYEYELKGVEPPTKEAVEKAKEIFRKKGVPIR